MLGGAERQDKFFFRSRPQEGPRRNMGIMQGDLSLPKWCDIRQSEYGVYA